MVDPIIQKQAIHRAKIIRGQMEGLIRVIEDEGYCHTLLMKSHLVQSSLRSLNSLLLENYLTYHAVTKMQDAQEQSRAIDDLLEVYQLLGKN